MCEVGRWNTAINSACTQQQRSRNKWLGILVVARYVFNHFLAQRHEQYRENGKAPTRFQQDKSLTALKQELPWLKEVDSTSLQAALQDLDTAYQNFFRRMKQGEKPRIPQVQEQTQPPAELQEQMRRDEHQSSGSCRTVAKTGQSEVPYFKRGQGPHSLRHDIPQPQRQVFCCPVLYGCGNKTTALHRGRCGSRYGYQVFRCHFRWRGASQPQASCKIREKASPAPAAALPKNEGEQPPGESKASVGKTA